MAIVKPVRPLNPPYYHREYSVAGGDFSRDLTADEVLQNGNLRETIALLTHIPHLLILWRGFFRMPPLAIVRKKLTTENTEDTEMGQTLMRRMPSFNILTLKLINRPTLQSDILR